MVARHIGRYPRMGAADTYKLLHQATMGPAHAALEPAAARARLVCEAAAVARRHHAPGGPAEPLMDPIRPAPVLARVHLEPWLCSGRPLEELLGAFLETAARWTERPGELEACLRAVQRTAERGELELDALGLARLVAGLGPQGFPAVRHSAAYRRAYRPAYRVVAPSILTGNVECADIPQREPE
jgi:hypothetical protein